MIKKIFLGIGVVVIAGALIFGAVLRTNARSGDENFSNENRGQGRRQSGWSEPVRGEVVHNEPLAGTQENMVVELPSAHLEALAVEQGSLTDDEIEGLIFMREEEKLARDVYLAMYALWGQPTFQNIALSEQTHINAVLELLEGYGVADPATNMANGEFANAELQALYDRLVEQGNRSLVDALKVGAAIEEIDILDLRERQERTDDEAILAVYENLESGSENHLRAFTSTLARKSGETYQPQYLNPDDYQTIISAANTNGRNGGRGDR